MVLHNHVGYAKVRLFNDETRFNHTDLQWWNCDASLLLATPQCVCGDTEVRLYISNVFLRSNVDVEVFVYVC